MSAHVDTQRISNNYQLLRHAENDYLCMAWPEMIYTVSWIRATFTFITLFSANINFILPAFKSLWKVRRNKRAHSALGPISHKYFQMVEWVWSWLFFQSITTLLICCRKSARCGDRFQFELNLWLNSFISDKSKQCCWNLLVLPLNFIENFSVLCAQVPTSVLYLHIWSRMKENYKIWKYLSW